MKRPGVQGVAWGRYPAIHGIAALTVLISVVAMAYPGVGDAAYAAGFIPAAWGAEGSLQPIPSLLTPVTSAFLHGGMLHLLFNMVMLVYCGRPVEAALGDRFIIALYGIGIYSSALAQWAVDPVSMTPVIGASGAASAIVGAYSAMFTQQKVGPIGPLSAYMVRILWLAAAWIGLQLLFGVAYDNSELGGGIAIWAHIGGFLAGLFLARPLLKRRYRVR